MPNLFIYIFKLIYYSQLFYSPKNLSQIITFDLFLSKILDYYLAFIPITTSKITSEPDLAESIPYILSSFLTIENNVENNKNLAKKKLL